MHLARLRWLIIIYSVCMVIHVDNLLYKMKHKNNLALVEVMFGIKTLMISIKCVCEKMSPTKSTYINDLQLMLTSDLNLSRHQNYIV